MHKIHSLDFFSLLQPKEGIHVSIYIPLHLKGMDKRENKIRLKNSLKAAEKLLHEKKAPPEFIKAFLQKTEELLHEKLFWLGIDKGLALFSREREYSYFHLPLDTPELVFVGDHFHIKPLLPIFSFEDSFYLLLLDQSGCKLLEMDIQEHTPVELPSCPKNVEELLQYDVHERHIEFHTKTPHTAGNIRAAIFHGQGDGEREHDAEVALYIKKVAESVYTIIWKEKQKKSLLILAGDPILVGRFRQKNMYPYVLEEYIAGSPTTFEEKELLFRARTLAIKHYQKQHTKELKSLLQESKDYHKHLTSTDLPSILQHAYQGKIRLLFVEPHTSKWGAYNPQEGTLSFHHEREGDDQDLIELAAVWTLQHRGKVIPLHTNFGYTENGMVAVFRYSLQHFSL